MSKILLKRGDRGDEVSHLQTQLKQLGFSPGQVDGIFGVKTSKALMDFQKEFLSTGVLDSVTREKIFDQIKKLKPVFTLPEITWTPSPNFSDRDGQEISLIIIHYTASGTLEQAVSWFENPASNASAHYVIGVQGEIVKMVREEKKAWHAGRSSWQGRTNCNRFSVGIELVNWGLLQKNGDEFFTWPKGYTQLYTGPEPVFSGEQYWTPYTHRQMASLAALCQDICLRYGLSAWDIVGHSDIAPDRKIDPGPALDWDLIRSAV